MAEKAKVPAIRFKGFIDEWEQRQVGEIVANVERPINMKDDEVYQLVTVKRRNEGVVSRGFLKGKDILVKNYFEIRAGDYIVSKRQVIHGATGFVPKSLDKSVVSNEYLVVVNSDTISTKFWTLTSKRFDMARMFFLSSYGVDVEKMVFNVEDWKKRSITIPSMTEQYRIIELFDELDNLITLYQRKLSKLENVKRATLNKMFPKRGSRTPEIRFAGFTDAWERREFGELVSRVSTPSENESILPRVEYDDIISGQGQLNKDIYDKKSNKTGIRFEPHDVLFGKLRPYLKNWLLSDFEGIAVGDFWIFRPQDTNHEFIYALIQTPKYQMVSNLSTGTKMPRSDWKIVSKAEFAVPPNIAEQKQIGEYFKALEHLITLHQRKLERLQNIKKSMLEKMFV